EVVKVPQMAESISEGTLKQWLKKEGDYVEQDEEVATIETDKIDVSVNAPSAGTITELLAKEEDTVSVGQDLFKLEAGGKGADKKGEAKSPTPSQEEKPEPTPKKQAKESTKDTRPSRQQQSKLDTPEEEPSRPKPQPSEPKQPEASQKAIDREKEKRMEEGTGVQKAPEDLAPKAGGLRTERRVKMNRMRIRIAERLKQSQNAAASLTTFNEIDMSAIIALRNRYKDRVLKEHNVKLGFMSAFAKASCLALKEIPAANASIEGPGAGEQIVYRDYVDLSVAVATPKGLVTPVIRNAEQMNFVEIEQAIAEAGKKARDGKLSLEDMAGGTFTISNGGVFGSLYGTPIINLPQSAVLGMHTIKDRPVVVDGQIVIRPIMIVALTYDHRLLDGREATTFLVKVKDYLENPASMLCVFPRLLCSADA
ncbi:dihydrolipoamide succinyltransferase, partial [Atractiella rhizophila]